jgi:hypothetical protein
MSQEFVRYHVMVALRAHGNEERPPLLAARAFKEAGIGGVAIITARQSTTFSDIIVVTLAIDRAVDRPRRPVNTGELLRDWEETLREAFKANKVRGVSFLRIDFMREVQTAAKTAAEIIAEAQATVQVSRIMTGDASKR